MELKELPDFPILKQLAESIWKEGYTKGAAVMIGAGFSRNAELLTPMTEKPPLWGDFQKAMQEETLCNSSDPLVVAQTYEGKFGRAALDGLIRRLIKDSHWSPSTLHHDLLSLPWNDILTTNWDTLLEKTVEESHELYRYNTVNIPADIARTSSPRIVKLHGSLPSYTPFTFTSNDYKEYPNKFSPFINLVRQVLLENDLCLIGFSGDDPNFKQWLKWVRKELGTSARRVFLIGNLNLSEKKREKLRQKNIIAIDLSPLFSGICTDFDPHYKGIKLVVDYFKQAQPKRLPDWPKQYEDVLRDEVMSLEDGTPGLSSDFALRDAQFALSQIQKKLPTLQSLIDSYPGWVVCPSSRREIFSHMFKDSLSGLHLAGELLSPIEQLRVASCMVWANKVAYWEISECRLKFISSVLDVEELDAEFMTEKLEIALTLLRLAREENDQVQFKYWKEWIKEHSKEQNMVRTEIYFQQALWARDHLDFDTLQKLVLKIEGSDPVWLLRQAGLFAELKDERKAVELIRKATHQLQLAKGKNPKSIWILSRLAWAAILSRALGYSSFLTDGGSPANEYEERGAWTQEFKEIEADPLDELDDLEKKIDAILKEWNESLVVKPKFDAGAFRDDSNTIKPSSYSQDSAVVQLQRVLDSLAVPLSLGYSGVSSGRMRKLLHFSEWSTKGDCLANLRILLHTSSQLFDNHLSRITVACISKEIAADLVEVLIQSITFLRERNNTSSRTEEVNRATELLSRLVIRLPASDALGVFQWACNDIMNEQYHHWWPYDGLKSLLKNSLRTLPPSIRGQQLLPVLLLPLPCEIKKAAAHFPNPIGLVVDDCCLKYLERKNDPRWGERIEKLIDVIENSEDKVSINAAALSLFYLAKNDLLSKKEKKTFIAVLWNSRKDTVFPNVNLLAHSYLSIPSPKEIDSRKLFQPFFEVEQSEEPGYYHLQTLIGASALEKPLLPNLQQAKKMLAWLLSWKVEEGRYDSHFFHNHLESIKSQVGSVLSYVILPVFTPKTWKQKYSKQLISWIEGSSIPSSIESLPQLVRLDAAQNGYVVKRLRRALVSRNKDQVRSGLNAINNWLKTPEVELPSKLINVVINNVSGCRYPLLFLSVYVSQQLVRKDLLDSEQIDTLVDALEDLDVETQYENWDQAHSETHNLSFVRHNNVLLAQALIEAGHGSCICEKWVEMAKNDPMPEVRFALEK